MPTSTLKTSNLLQQDQGFTLIEILVALLLASIIFLAIPSSDNSRRHQDLQGAVGDIDRSIRFATNESILRNTVVRVSIDMDKSPVEYVVEYGPKDGLVLPELTPEKEMGVDEKEKEIKRLGQLNSQFTKVEEFGDINRKFPGEVEVMGVGTTFQHKLIKQGVASIYFYPTGERDGSIIFFSTPDELAVMEIQPFQEKIAVNYHPVPPADSGVANTEKFLENKMQEISKDWLDK